MIGLAQLVLSGERLLWSCQRSGSDKLAGQGEGYLPFGALAVKFQQVKLVIVDSANRSVRVLLAGRGTLEGYLRCVELVDGFLQLFWI